MITAMSLPFLAKKPIDLPPIVSVELIQITDKTNIPFAPKAKKTIEKIKEKEKKLVSEQAPPKKVKKIKPDSVPMPDDKVKKVEKVKIINSLLTRQHGENVKNRVFFCSRLVFRARVLVFLNRNYQHSRVSEGVVLQKRASVGFFESELPTLAREMRRGKVGNLTRPNNRQGSLPGLSFFYHN